MSIPAYTAFYDSILKTLSDGNVHDSKEVLVRCVDAFHLSAEDQAALLPSSNQTIVSNRVGWARTYLKKAGLISSPSRGHYQITEEGKKALAASVVVDNTYLSRYRGFRDFMQTGRGRSSLVASLPEDASPGSTPIELMTQAFDELNEQLADNLLVAIMAKNPAFFERLVVDLLEHMGYGGKVEHSGTVTGQTGDEGIDGIIREDALGFDKIYIQAKRWQKTHAVGEPDIQQFAGALMGKGATKGLFITTSEFSKPAQEYVDRHMNAKIVLVDGKELTRLMIHYGVGVSTMHTYEIKRIDSDYFNDEEE